MGAMAAGGTGTGSRRHRTPRWARRAYTVRPRRAPGRRVVTALMVLTVAVQVLVWGRAPTTGGGGALLPQLRPVAGIAYAVIVVVLELLLSTWVSLRHGATVVLVTSAVVDFGLWMARLGGLAIPAGAAASFTAAAGAVALCGALLSGRLGMTTRPRPRGRARRPIGV